MPRGIEAEWGDRVVVGSWELGLDSSQLPSNEGTSSLGGKEERGAHGGATDSGEAIRQDLLVHSGGS